MGHTVKRGPNQDSTKQFLVVFMVGVKGIFNCGFVFAIVFDFCDLRMVSIKVLVGDFGNHFGGLGPK